MKMSDILRDLADMIDGIEQGGAIDIANTAVHLDYTCITALATGS